MFKNFFVTAWRNLLRNKFYSSINIAGLAVGLSVGIMILLWVQDELGFDKFHSNAANIFKINSHLGFGNDEQEWEGVPSPVAVHSTRKIPEVQSAVRVADNYGNSLFEYQSKKLIGTELAYADPSFFTLFDFKLIKGNKSRPFGDSHSVIITKGLAKRFFGDADPIGKVLVADKNENFNVTGVLEDFPANSSIHYNMIFPMDLYAERFRGNGDWKTIDEDLGNYSYRIYLQLKPGSSVKQVESKLTKMYSELRNGHEAGTTFTLQSITDLHLYASDGSDSAMQIVRIFILVAIFILIIACINYVNLSTARAIVRSKEVSVRKIIGANRKQLFIQFIIESVLLFSFSSIVAYLIIQLLMPLYNQISGKQLVFSLGDANVWLVLSLAIVGSLVVASIYPAVLLSSFKPMEALKGKISSGVGNAAFRKVLVIAQFVLSVGLITSTMVIGLQLKYIHEKDLGYDKQHVFAFDMRTEMLNHLDAVRSELRKSPAVIGVATSTGNIIGMYNSTGDTYWEGKDANRTFLIRPAGIDENFIPLFKLKVASGKNFSGSKADSAHIILNETAVREAGIKDPIGKKFTLWQTAATIIGVVKDYNYASLKQKIEPTAFYYTPTNGRLYIKTSGREADKAIATAQKVWMRYSPEYPFNYSFVDEDYDKLYKAEDRTGILFNVFAVVAILISCLGLFGLSTYTAHVRRKEVGIRKVLGAGISSITTLLAKDFLVLVTISLVIAIPLAWWAMHSWLQDFVYRITLSWWIFGFAAAAAMLIALMTVSFQSIRAAMANPVDSLKEE